MDPFNTNIKSEITRLETLLEVQKSKLGLKTAMVHDPNRHHEMASSPDRSHETLQEVINEKNAKIKVQEDTIDKWKKLFSTAEEIIDKKDAKIEDQEISINSKGKLLSMVREIIDEKDARIEEQEGVIAKQAAKLKNLACQGIYMRWTDNEKCRLCKHVKSIFGHGSSGAMHGMTRNKWGSEVIIMLTCPHICKMDIKETNEFLKFMNFCRLCLVHPIGQGHTEVECSKRLKHLKCKEAACSNNLYVCYKHQHLHQDRITAKQRELSLAGIYCKF